METQATLAEVGQDVPDWEGLALGPVNFSTRSFLAILLPQIACWAHASEAQTGIVSSGLASENLEQEVSFPAASLAWKSEAAAATRRLGLPGL